MTRRPLANSASVRPFSISWATREAGSRILFFCDFPLQFLPRERLKSRKRRRSPMVKLYEKERDRLVAEITEDQFRFLADHLEEESENDQDYYLNMDTLDFLEE